MNAGTRAVRVRHTIFFGWSLFFRCAHSTIGLFPWDSAFCSGSCDLRPLGRSPLLPKARTRGLPYQQRSSSQTLPHDWRVAFTKDKLQIASSAGWRRKDSEGRERAHIDGYSVIALSAMSDPNCLGRQDVVQVCQKAKRAEEHSACANSTGESTAGKFPPSSSIRKASDASGNSEALYYGDWLSRICISMPYDAIDYRLISACRSWAELC